MRKIDGIYWANTKVDKYSSVYAFCADLTNGLKPLMMFWSNAMNFNCMPFLIIK